MRFMKSVRECCLPTPHIPTGEARIIVKIYQYSTDPDATLRVDIETSAKLKMHDYRDVSNIVINDAQDIDKLPVMHIHTEFPRTIAANITDYNRLSCQINGEVVHTCTFPITTKSLNDFISTCEQKIQESLALENLNPRYTCRK